MAEGPSLFPASASSQLYLTNTSSLHPWDIPGVCRLCRPPKGLLWLYCLSEHIYSVPCPVVNAWTPAFKTKIKNQNTLGKRDLNVEMELMSVNWSESSRLGSILSPPYMHMSFIQQGLQIHGIYFLSPFICPVTATWKERQNVTG